MIFLSKQKLRASIFVFFCMVSLPTSLLADGDQYVSPATPDGYYTVIKASAVEAQKLVKSYQSVQCLKSTDAACNSCQNSGNNFKNASDLLPKILAESDSATTIIASTALNVSTVGAATKGAASATQLGQASAVQTASGGVSAEEAPLKAIIQQSEDCMHSMKKVEVACNASKQGQSSNALAKKIEKKCEIISTYGLQRWQKNMANGQAFQLIETEAVSKAADLDSLLRENKKVLKPSGEVVAPDSAAVPAVNRAPPGGVAAASTAAPPLGRAPEPETSPSNLSVNTPLSVATATCKKQAIDDPKIILNDCVAQTLANLLGK